MRALGILLMLFGILAAARAAPVGEPGRVFRDCADCPEMVVLPAGEFIMGSPTDEEGRRKDENPPHKVTIATIAIGKYELTFAEWDSCVADGGCKTNPDHNTWGRGKRPVINLSWDAITGEYLPWLNRKLGLSGAEAYRLPSEAEWEYAARARTKTPFSSGATITTDKANFAGNSTYGGSSMGVYRGMTVAVGTFEANAFGLHDMHGNVSEWVEDCYVNSYNAAPDDGSAVERSGCEKRVLRGGSWFDEPVNARSAKRGSYHNWSYSGGTEGFRLARTLPPAP